MTKIEEIKSPKEDSEDSEEEIVEESETEEIANQQRDTGWDAVLSKDVNPTLDRRIISSGGFSLGGNLESSLEDVPSENIDEDKKPETYKLDSSSYMGKGGVLGDVTDNTKRVEEFVNEGPVRTFNQWNPEFENSAQLKMYEVKNNVEDTLKEPHEAEAFQKYSTRR